jgi:hypoxanthine phosphoribosyltransferase
MRPGKKAWTMTLEAMVFDYGVLFQDDLETEKRLRYLPNRLKSLGIKVVVFSTHDQDIDAELEKRGLPPSDLCLFRSTVGVSKGSSRWMEMVTDLLGIELYQCAYVGDDKQDWLTAIKSAVFYIHAGWSEAMPPDVTAVEVQKPLEILGFITHFLLIPPRCEYTLDVKDHRLHVRSLLNAFTVLPATKPRDSFTLQDVFHKNRKVRVGERSARNLLMLHLLSSVYLEGLIVPGTRFAVWPSSRPGMISPSLNDYLETAARLLGGYFRRDLLTRAKRATDMSAERYYAFKEGRDPNESFTNQTNTAHVNPSYRNLIRTKNRNVLVFDDFTTTGMSLEWARNLLYAGGADRVVLLTIGKYVRKNSPTYSVYEPQAPDLIRPYELDAYAESDFTERSYTVNRNPTARDVITNSFQRFKDGKLYPVDRRR